MMLSSGLILILLMLVTCLNGQETPFTQTHCAKMFNTLADIKSRIQQMENILDEPARTANNSRNCKEVLKIGYTTTGFKTIFPDGINSVQALCVMDVEGGGWTVIQNRQSDSVMFLQMWQEYRNGFGDNTSFWLGLENIRLLTSQGNYELRVDLRMDDTTEAIVKYQTFAVGNESAQYPITVGGYSFVPTYAGQPDPGDALSGNNGMVFTAMDSTGDTCLPNGYWFRTYMPCYYSNLNGEYGDPSFGGILWGNWTGVNLDGNRLLVYTRMMIRPA